MLIPPGKPGASRTIVDEVIILSLLRAGLRPEELCILRLIDTPVHHGRPELHVQTGPARTQRVVSIPQEIVGTFRRFVRMHRGGAKPSDSLRLVQQQAGHARVKSTARHLRPGRLRQRCEVCDTPIARAEGTRIDSGQLLCPSCLKDLRSH